MTLSLILTDEHDNFTQHSVLHWPDWPGKKDTIPGSRSLTLRKNCFEITPFYMERCIHRSTNIQYLGNRLVSITGQFKLSLGSPVSHICDGGPHWLCFDLRPLCTIKSVVLIK